MQVDQKQLDAIRSSDLFDAAWYLDQYPDVTSMGMDPAKHYLWIGAHLGRNPSAKFDTGYYLETYPDVAKAGLNPLVHFELCGKGEGRLTASFDLISKWGDIECVSELYTGIKNLRESNYENAVLNLEKYHNHQSITNINLSFGRLFNNISGNNIFKKTTTAQYNINIDKKICIYTALFGDYDELKEPLYIDNNIDYICFSDKTHNANGWKYSIVNDNKTDNVTNNRKYKLLPHRFLNQYDYSIYIDSNIVLVGDTYRFIKIWLADKEFVAWPHPERSDIYNELEAIIAHQRHEPRSIVSEYMHYKKERVPRNTGLVEACFLWRAHNKTNVKQLMEFWWSNYGRFSKRDQPVLGYSMWKLDTYPIVLPAHIGTSRDNDLYFKFEHKNCTQNKNTNFLKQQRRNIAWVYQTEFQNVASTKMRGNQLFEIYKNFSIDNNPFYINNFDVKKLNDHILILTKGFLKKKDSFNTMELLKNNGNILCLDYIDDPENAIFAEFTDVYIASSIAQHKYYLSKYPEKIVHMITHHVDPRIPYKCSQTEKFAACYFGEIVNAKFSSELQKYLDFYQVDTKNSNTDWLSKLQDYNLHYAVRNHRDIDGFKPFLKGFTAAHCNANIIVPRDESDARYYLGPDYPYLLKNDSLEEVKKMYEYSKESFGGPEWRYALEIMTSVRQRTSQTQIVDEIDSLVSRLS